MISEWDNPAHLRVLSVFTQKRTQGSETSQYLKEEKSIEILLVAASENGLERLYLAYRLVEVVGMQRDTE